jgi:hypothetical protein
VAPVARRWAPKIAGPLLIALCPLAVLNGFWLGGRLTDQHVDLLSFWLPRWCFLGTSLADGHIPTWLPHQFAGVPFASDPQSGWLYAPAMLLFSTFSCTRALGLLVALNPVIAGAGLYAFFRLEGVSRPAATVGGLTLALTMAGSVVALSMPFAGMLAWTAVALAGAAGYLHARAGVGMLGWLGLTAFALSQVAAAHLTHGLVMAVMVVGLYVVARSMALVRTGVRSTRGAVVAGLSLFLAFPVLAAAVFVPRVALLPRSSLGHGYVELARLTAELSGPLPRPILADVGVSPWWGTSFARGPGGFVGSAAILLIAVALWSRRWRLPAVAFTIAGAIGWLLNLDWLVGSQGIRDLVLPSWLGEMWLRDPARLRYLPLIAFAALAGYGFQAWLDLAPLSTHRALALRALWLAAPVALFCLLPIVAGSPIAPYGLFLAGTVAAVPLLLAAATRRPPWAGVALSALVAVQLTVAGLIPLLSGPRPRAGPLRGEPQEAFGHSFAQLHPPNVDPAAYLAPGSIGRVLIRERDTQGRYLTFDREVAGRWRGFLTDQSPATWPAYENGRSILLGLDEVQGYSPLQLDRYWRLVRTTNPTPILYNAATFQAPPPEVLAMLGVHWVIAPAGDPPSAGAAEVAAEGGYRLHRLNSTRPRASLVFRWRRVPSGRALDAVLGGESDPRFEAIVEGDPMVGGMALTARPLGRGSANYDVVSANHVRVRMTSTAPGLLIVRNAFDPNWRATVDGRQGQVMRAEYLMQAVPFLRGDHTIELTYRDDPIGYGLAVSGVAWASLAATVGWLMVGDRRRRITAAPTTAASTAAVPANP